MGRAAELLRPTHVIIENVTGALHDQGRVVQTTQEWLESLGYHVSVGLVDLVRIGVPQRRRRLLIVASLTKRVEVASLAAKYGTGTRDVRWAVNDLMDKAPTTLLDQPAESKPDTRKRISYLFENDVYELPNEFRPACHRDKDHSYNSIYGRLRWNKPSQTITRGFYSMCMGRYVHPERPRTLTAHEAARLQFFPDSFDFTPVRSRTALARIIGNAVPMKLPYAAGLELLAEGVIR
jgi:DNA (cytosine-5)-methyltransferase 1